ncbi:MAG: hypothetical protein LUQ37_07280 [Methanoregulaceae archaeon]|jgi:hypothetical protein|nr:hypothetical protein [Methanoregulaceae archaeon]
MMCYSSLIEREWGRGITMYMLNLTGEEVTILKTVLEEYLSDLRMEVADTDKQDFRNNLKKEEETIKEILGTLTRMESSRK